MNAIDRINVRHTLNTISRELERTMGQTIFDISVPHLVTDAFDAQLELLRERQLFTNYRLASSQVTHYSVHDGKNCCLVRLLNDDEKVLTTLLLRGRRLANKIARRRIGSLYMDYSFDLIAPATTATINLCVSGRDM